MRYRQLRLPTLTCIYFLDAGMGNVLAFFEIPNSPNMGRDENTPQWVQHIALEVEDVDALVAAKAELTSTRH